jgi:fatty acid desaturase
VRLRELAELSQLRGPLAVAADWAVIALAFAFARLIHAWWGYALAVLVIGNRQHALGVLGHEGAHRLLHPSPFLNRWVSQVFCFWPLSGEFDGYRQWHFDHHRHVGTDDDPELVIKLGPKHEIPLTRGGLALIFVGDLLGLGAVDVLKLVFAVRPRRYRDLAGLTLFWGAVLTTCWAAGALWIALVWFAALFTSFWAFFRFRGLTEHTGTTGTLRFRPGLFWRTVVFPHGTWCHWEHHQWAFIPYYRLTDARSLEGETAVWTMSDVMRFFATHRGRTSSTALPLDSAATARSDRE